MIHISAQIAALVRTAIEAAQGAGDLPAFAVPDPIPVTRPKNEEHGDYATPVAMQLARLAKMAPPQIAEVITNHFPASELIGSVELAGGFINVRLSEDWLRAQVDVILAEGEQAAQSETHSGKWAQVECVSANPTGPIHLGRIRGGVIGDALARLLRAQGYTVEMEYYYNNGGKQMENLAASIRARYLQQLGHAAEFPEAGYQGDYIAEIASSLIEARGDSLVDSADLEPFRAYGEQVISGWQKASLARINIEHDTFFNEDTLYEQAVWDVLAMLEQRNLTYKAVQPRREDSDQAPPPDADKGEAVCMRMMDLRDTVQDVIIVRSDGTPTYRLPDFAYHVDKFERGFDLMLNVLGADHIEEAKDVKATMGALGYDQERLQHVIHQFLKVVQGGEVIRGSTRSGEYLALDDLLDMLLEHTTESFAVDVVRYFTLAHNPNTHMTIDVDAATQQTNENPVFYIQNAHVRCAGIAREAADRGLDHSAGDVALLTDPQELRLIRKLVELPEIIQLAADELEPHRLAYWAQEDLAATFHPVYDEVRAIHTEVPEALTKARLKLYAAAQVVLRRVLDLMGMSAPERM